MGIEPPFIDYPFKVKAAGASIILKPSPFDAVIKITFQAVVLF